MSVSFALDVLPARQGMLDILEASTLGSTLTNQVTIAVRATAAQDHLIGDILRGLNYLRDYVRDNNVLEAGGIIYVQCPLGKHDENNVTVTNSAGDTPSPGCRISFGSAVTGASHPPSLEIDLAIEDLLKHMQNTRQFAFLSS